MISPLLRRGALVAALALVGACEDHEFHPPDQAAREARAESAFVPELFDTVAWDSAAARIQTGNLVFADECRRCHGPLGRGETEYATANQLDVPSLVRPDWVFEGRLDSLRRQIFVGHGRQMPGWGLGRLSPRQIDAAAAYILEQLRPEVLSGAGRIPGD